MTKQKLTAEKIQKDIAKLRLQIHSGKKKIRVSMVSGSREI